MQNTNNRRAVGAAATAVLAAGLLVAGTAATQPQAEKTSASHRITTAQQLTEHIQLAVATEREQSTGNETYCGQGRSE